MIFQQFYSRGPERVGGGSVGGNFWVYVARALFSYKWVQCLNINLH